MQIDLGGARLEVALEGGILDARRLPIGAELANHRRIEAGVALAVAQGLHDRAEAGLRCRARHGIDGRVDGVDPGFGRREHGRRRYPRRVMRVQMQRQAARLPQGLDEHARAGGPQQARHVLDREDMAAGPFQLLGDADIIVERIFGAIGIENVARVADRALGELAGLAHGIDRDTHVLDPVEAIENAEEIDARWRRGCTKYFTTLSG